MSVDVPLDNIKIKEIDTITLDGGLSFAISPLNVGVTQLPAISLGVTELPDLNFNLAVAELPTIRLETNSALDSDSRVSTDSKVTTDSKVDLALDVRLRELPQIDLQFGFRPMRFHFPFSYRFGLTLFGCRIFELASCGEGMIVAEDYTPKISEQCE